MINTMSRRREKDNLIRQNKLYQDINRFAEDVVSTKYHVISLCEKQNSNREALAAISKKHLYPENSKQKAWVNMGGMFIKMDKEQCKSMIQEEQAKLRGEIEEGRNSQQEKVARLRDAEGKSHVTAFNLKPLSRSEIKCVKY